ncbi:MAG: LacI family DNA-binding transcriptional regulator [Alphaproteobacteria bacterium]
MTTIYDVARRAGVSPKTVSRVINQEPNVKLSTKEAVLSAVAELGYRPSTAARLMKSQRTNVIGFLTDQVVTTPESIDIARGVSEAAEEAGQTVLFVTDGDSSNPLSGRGFDSLIDLKIDGLIYAAHSHRLLEVTQHDRNLPTVLANCFDPSGKISSVVPDDRVGGYLAGQMLIEYGHRHVAFLNLDKGKIASSLRAEGFKQAFQEQGLPTPLIKTAIGVNAGTWEEHVSVPAALDTVLSASPRPTAIFCGNDKMAMVVYGLLAERGLQVPEHISIVGFDDYNLITRLLRPQLSSVAIGYYEIGQQAVTSLLGLIGARSMDQSHQASRIMIPGWAKHRDSIKNMKASGAQSSDKAKAIRSVPSDEPGTDQSGHTASPGEEESAAR